MGIARKIADAAQFMAEVPKNSWTLGGIMPAITNGEFRPHIIPMNRTGRILERTIFAAGVVIAVAGCIAETSVFPAMLVLPITKLIGVTAGGIGHLGAEKMANITHSFERMVSRTAFKMGIKQKPAEPKPAKPQKAAKAPKPQKPGRVRKPRDQRMLHKFAKGMDWLNDFTGNKYTIGDISRRLVGLGPSGNGLLYTRVGRFAERVGTLGAVAALLIIGGPPVNIGFVVMLAGCKMVGVTAGLVAMQGGKFIGGAAHALDAHLNRARPGDDATGARMDELAKKMAGARPQPGQQPQPAPANDKTGASPTQLQQPQEQVLREQFKQSAAKPLQGLEGSRIFSATGPRNAEAYGLTDVTLESPITQALKAAQQQQQQQRRM